MRLNTIKPNAGSRRAAPARRPRRLRRPGQDLRPRRQGPARAQGRLPQGRLRGRPDAAAAPHAQGRLPLGHQGAARRGAPARAGRRSTAAVIDLAALKAAQIVGVFAESAKVVLSGKLEEGRAPQGHRRHQGRARGHRSRRRQGRSLMANPALSNPAATLAEAGAHRRDPHAPAVPAGRAGRLPHRHLHPGAGHRPGAGAALLHRPVRTASSAWSTASAAARCSACRSSPWA